MSRRGDPKRMAYFQGTTVTALRARAWVVAKPRPRIAVTVAPKTIVLHLSRQAQFSDSLSDSALAHAAGWYGRHSCGFSSTCSSRDRLMTIPSASRLITRLLPPALISGCEIPLGGTIAVTTATLSIACPKT